MRDGGSQHTAASPKRPDILLATWAAGPWKPTASQPGENASHPSSPPSGAPPAPSPRQVRPALLAGARLPPRARTWRSRSRRRAVAPAGVSGAQGRSEEKQIYKPGSPCSFAAAGGSSSPSRSGRDAGGGCQRPRPPPEPSGRPGPVRRQDGLRSVGAAAPPTPTPGPSAPHPPRWEKARRARTAAAPAPTAPSPPPPAPSARPPPPSPPPPAGAQPALPGAPTCGGLRRSPRKAPARLGAFPAAGVGPTQPPPPRAGGGRAAAAGRAGAGGGVGARV